MDKVTMTGKLPTWTSGALAGLLATGPMTVVMLGLHRRLPRHEQYPLPPRQITEEIVEKSGAEPVLNGERSKRTATWLAHFGYGASVGSLYPLTTGRLDLPAALRGMLFGILVWAGSYMGWLPAFNILPPATRHARPPQRINDCRTPGMGHDDCPAGAAAEKNE
jgi:hypothetical protein